MLASIVLEQQQVLLGHDVAGPKALPQSIDL